jgi:hypothetical protein
MEKTKVNLKEAKKFDKWMKKTVKSVYYSDHKKMTNAYLKVN